MTTIINPYDQFDAAPQATPQVAQAANPYDQFDEPEQTPQATPQPQGLMDNINQSMQLRGANAADIANRRLNNKQTDLESDIQQVGNQVGAAGDILGHVASSAAKTGYEALPDTAKQYLGQKASDIVNSPLGQMGINALHSGEKTWDGFKQANPRVAADIGAFGNIATAFTPVGEAGSAAEAVGGAASGATKLVGKGANAIAEATAKTPLITSGALKNMARTSYDVAEKSGGTLTPDFANKFYKSIEDMKPQTEHGIATAGENELAKLTNDWEGLKDKPISLQAAQEMDEGLSQKIDGHVDKTTGKLDKEGGQLYDVQTNFRNMIDKATPGDITGGTEGFDALKNGRALWSTAARTADLERIITRAQMMQNPDTAIKAGFRNLYNNPARMSGYSDGEKAAIKTAAEGGKLDGIRNVLGSRLIATIVGSHAGGPVGGIAGAALSGATRGLSNTVQLKRANDAIRTVQQKVPNLRGLQP